jgi:2-polyprenyl-6-methoxyphenol hydroxylase-like FAD-dependent oxidoreductase
MRVLIVGAGIAGLSLAIALERRGIRAQVIERSAGQISEGAGLYLVGNATRALLALGVGERVILAGCPIRTQRIFNQNGRALAERDVETFWKECGPCLGVRRSRLHVALMDQAAHLPIRFGMALRSLQQSAEGVVVQTNEGAEEHYDLVVGADGIRSSVREMEFGASAPTFRGQVGWRFIAPVPEGMQGWSVFLGSGRTFLFVPLGDGEAYCYADLIVAHPFGDPTSGRLDRLKALFSDFAPPVRETLERMRETDTIHFAPIEEVRQATSARGRVVLIGDAAHAMSPNMASGAAMAFEDALVLAEVLGQRTPVPAALDEFARRRASRVGWIRSQTDRRDRMRSLPGPLRNMIIRFMWPRIYAANYRPLCAPP